MIFELRGDKVNKKTLYKLFYADQLAFNTEYNKRFDDENIEYIL